MPKELLIKSVQKTMSDGEVTVSFLLNDGINDQVLWYKCSDKYEAFVSDDRCDSVVVGLLINAMKAGFTAIRSNLPLSEKLYYQLKYHVIPQIRIAPRYQKLQEIEIDAPLTRETFNGPKVACGMSCGVDSFATLQEYGDDFELEDYRINALTYYRAGAHGHASHREEMKFTRELARVRDFCGRYRYELIELQSNLDEVLLFLLPEDFFYRTHTVRNVSMTLFLQKLIRRYYYSSAFNLDNFEFSLTTAMGHYEKWLLPLLGTESTSFYSSSQNWTRLEKLRRISTFDPCYDYLTVCLGSRRSCLKCKKCKRTLMELDSLGDGVLDKFSHSFKVEEYKREYREKWFDEIVDYKDSDNPDALYFDELFAYAAEHNPAILGELIRTKRPGVKKVVLQRRAVARKFPSRRAEAVSRHAKKETLRYLGEYGIWVAIEESDGSRAFVPAAKVNFEPEH